MIEAESADNIVDKRSCKLAYDIAKECEKAVLSKSTIFHLPKLSDDCCTAIAFASVCYDIETGPAWLYILEKCRENFHN